MSDISRREFMPPGVPCVESDSPPHDGVQEARRKAAAICLSQCLPAQVAACQGLGQSLAEYKGSPRQVIFGGQSFTASPEAQQQPGQGEPTFSFPPNPHIPEDDSKSAWYIRTIYRSDNFQKDELPPLSAQHMQLLNLTKDQLDIPHSVSPQTVGQIYQLAARMLTKSEAFPISSIMIAAKDIISDVKVHLDKGLTEEEALERAFRHDASYYYERKKTEEKTVLHPDTVKQRIRREANALRKSVWRIGSYIHRGNAERAISNVWAQREAVLSLHEDANRIEEIIRQKRRGVNSRFAVLVRVYSNKPEIGQQDLEDVLRAELLLALGSDQGSTIQRIHQALKVSSTLRMAPPEVVSEAGKDIEAAYHKIMQASQESS